MEILSLAVPKALKTKYYANLESVKFTADDDFFTFPEKPTFLWDDETGILRASALPDYLNSFLQQWLFFGLLRTVLQDEGFDEADFIEHGNIPGSTRYIRMDQLPKYLESWKQRINDRNTRTVMSLIKAQFALDKARKVLMKWYSLDWDEWDMNRNLYTQPNDIDPNLALSLMMLGEVLTNAKCQIVEPVGITVRGWHGNANEGWGIPYVVVNFMLNKGWCIRTIYVLSCQLKSHATALLAACRSYAEIESLPETSFKILSKEAHEKCERKECKFKSTEKNGSKYKTRHRESCRSVANCAMVGPDVNCLVNIIRSNQTPLLRYDKASSTVIVEPYTRQKYATISHVWSDGYGNRDDAQLPECQVKYISDLLEARVGGRTLFWMDTLANPPHSFKEERRTAVQRIGEVYRYADFTLVLDLALNNITTGQQYHEIALRILASGWMRRLWTLQEAYLSRKIIFAFIGKEQMDLDDLESSYSNARDLLASNVATPAKAYFYHMMGPERKHRLDSINSTEEPPKKLCDVIASVWRSAQWRTINYPGQEVLALATLLEVNYQDGEWDRTQQSDQQRELMMKKLWNLLQRQDPTCVPSGIVFMPGQRLQLKGFGWAPLTWMSGQEISHPDPLSTPQLGAEIVHEKGLKGRYPGFLLHSKLPDSVFWPDQNPIEFPIDSTLLEWYEVERADPLDASGRSPRGTKLERMRFAILLSRPKPREIEEIALLVHIAHEQTQKNPRSRIFEAQIICRVWIKRVIRIDRASKWREFCDTTRNDDKDFICGEELDSAQEWILDGYFEDLPIRQDTLMRPTLDSSALTKDKVSPSTFPSQSSPSYTANRGRRKRVRPRRTASSINAGSSRGDNDSTPPTGILRAMTFDETTTQRITAQSERDLQDPPIRPPARSLTDATR